MSLVYVYLTSLPVRILTSRHVHTTTYSILYSVKTFFYNDNGKAKAFFFELFNHWTKTDVVI
jgi:hypothetical protein